MLIILKKKLPRKLLFSLFNVSGQGATRLFTDAINSIDTYRLTDYFEYPKSLFESIIFLLFLFLL